MEGEGGGGGGRVGLADKLSTKWTPLIDTVHSPMTAHLQQSLHINNILFMHTCLVLNKVIPPPIEALPAFAYVCDGHDPHQRSHSIDSKLP